MEKVYNVLWIDDQCSDLSQFVEAADMENIILHPYEVAKDGLAALEKDIDLYDAVILDAKCWKDSSDETPSTKGMYTAMSKINELRKQRYMPYFIYTGQPDLITDSNFANSIESGEYYSKSSIDDQRKLFSDIKAAADKQPETQIRHKYADVFFDAIDPASQSLLVKILMALDEGSERDTELLNSMRKIIESMYGWFCANNLTKSRALNEFSRFLCALDFVPIYVQRSIHSIVIITQDGSHRQSTFECLISGLSPYLVRNMTYELLNILEWWRRLVGDDELQNKFAAKKDMIIDSNSAPKNNYSKSPEIEEYDCNPIEGFVEQDGDNNFHCANVLLSFNDMNTGYIARKIRVNKYNSNTSKSTKRLYDRFAFFKNCEFLD